MSRDNYRYKLILIVRQTTQHFPEANLTYRVSTNGTHERCTRFCNKHVLPGGSSGEDMTSCMLWRQERASIDRSENKYYHNYSQFLS